MEKPGVHVLQAFKQCLCNQVDPLKIAQCLWKHNAINVSQKKVIIFLTQNNRKEAWEYLLPFIDGDYIFQQFLKSLLMCNYSELFLQMLTQYHCLKTETSNTRGLVCIQRAHSLNESRRFSQDLFIDMKIKTHNVSIGNPRKYLRGRSEFYCSEFKTENDGLQKMIKADRYAASLCAELDSHTMLLSPDFPTHGLFEKLQELIPFTSNTCVTQVAHDCRMANVLAITGNGDKGSDFLQRAMVSSTGIGHCVELINMLYIHVFNLIYVFEKNPTYLTLEKIINISEYSLHCLGEEKYDLIRIFWMRMFYLRVTFCLLGISNNCKIIPGFVVLPKYIKKAKMFIAEVDKMWEGIEARRKMFYYVAQARVCELEDDIEITMAYINMALDMGIKGNFSETISIQKYAQSLLEKSDKGHYMDSNILDLNVSYDTLEAFNKYAIEHEESTPQLAPKKIPMEHGEEVDTCIKNFHTEDLSDQLSCISIQHDKIDEIRELSCTFKCEDVETAESFTSDETTLKITEI